MAHVAVVAQSVLKSLVVDVLIVVEPHFGHTYCVSLNEVGHVRWHRVRIAIAKYVANVATRYCNQLAATHPNLYNKQTTEFHIYIVQFIHSFIHSFVQSIRTTLHLERKLEIFASPDFHAVVVDAKRLEELTTDRKQAACE